MSDQALKPTRFALGKAASQRLTSTLSFIILCFGAVLALIPILWMLSTSLKSPGDVLLLPPRWIPDPIMWSNYVHALTSQPFNIYYRNTIVYTLSAVFGETFSSAMVAYALARLRGPWPSCLLYHHHQHDDAAVAGNADPAILAIPHARLGGHAAAADRTDLLWQRFLYLSAQPVLSHHPHRDGGCRTHRRRQRVSDLLVDHPAHVPPALATVAIMSFMYHWNNFMGPLIYLSSKDNLVVSVGIAALHGSIWGHPLGSADGGGPGGLAAVRTAFLFCATLLHPGDRRSVQGLKRLSEIFDGRRSV